MHPAPGSATRGEVRGQAVDGYTRGASERIRAGQHYRVRSHEGKKAIGHRAAESAREGQVGDQGKIAAIGRTIQPQHGQNVWAGADPRTDRSQLVGRRRAATGT